ncbi:hypothetical protein BRE01_41970 [Brevibacillus reuszeri]|uniref:Crp/Fnr family transcriptional regulator n=1 Tax=Brevibacillus reuszeri TaxID=54915 RepID=A0ABQ0TRP8_9BACL|nr:Crp/Fnr family transcriptional regulator [Brevibacillus reuszeri]MED1860992.1 Crp/Fnr family transcriptional regulator [Brevibacillus reuszeri]GED70495.1 hypothetical protein BRE01_41970 [Brevibacillus reuszeri]
MLESIRDVYQATPWLENLPSQWDLLKKVGTPIECKKDTMIFEQDDKADFLYLIASGRVCLYASTPSGEEKAIAFIGKNGLIGEYDPLSNLPHTTSAITVSKTLLYRTSVSQFRELLKENFHLVEQLLHFESRKYRLLCAQALQLSYSKAPHRICATLIQLALNYGSPLEQGQIKITTTFTHQEVANLVGTTRITVINTLKWLERHHILVKQDKYYVITDLDRLEALVQDDTWKLTKHAEA